MKITEIPLIVKIYKMIFWFVKNIKFKKYYLINYNKKINYIKLLLFKIIINNYSCWLLYIYIYILWFIVIFNFYILFVIELYIYYLICQY